MSRRMKMQRRMHAAMHLVVNGGRLDSGQIGFQALGWETQAWSPMPGGRDRAMAFMGPIPWTSMGPSGTACCSHPVTACRCSLP